MTGIFLLMDIFVVVVVVIVRSSVRPSIHPSIHPFFFFPPFFSDGSVFKIYVDLAN